MTARSSLLLAHWALALGLALALPAAAEGTFVAGKYGDWTLHVNESKSSRICFITAAP